MRHVSRIAILALAAAASAAAIAAGCASAPLKTEASTSGIRAAEEVGAADVPQAALHLQLAKEELARAKRLSVKGAEVQAQSMLLRAQADAELAVALSREDAEKTEAEAAVERVRKLRQDNE
jgi:outer membrane murein-binding lipoprotein Lpp